jgi:hypothetical protein
MTQIYQYQPNTQKEKDFHAQYLKKNSNHQMFQYSKKHKNLKEERKIQQIPWNEKKCVENAKISGEIGDKNTQHDMINQ